MAQCKSSTMSMQHHMIETNTPGAPSKVSMRNFPSKLSEPKVVVLWSSEQQGCEEKVEQMNVVLRKQNIRAEALDVSLRSNKKNLGKFSGATDGEYPQLFLYECNIGDLICMASAAEFSKNQEEFEDCVGADQMETDKGDEKLELAESLKTVESKGFQQKSVTRYTSEEMAAYIMHQSLNELTRNMIKYKVTGKDLKRVSNPAQLMKLLHVNKEVADDFFQVLQEEKEKEVAAKSGQQVPETSANWMKKPMQKWSTRETKGWMSSFIADEEERKIVFAAADKQRMNGALIVRYITVDHLAEQLELDVDDKLHCTLCEKIVAAAKMQMDKEFDNEGDDDTKEKEKEFRIRDFRKHKHIRSSKQEDCIMKYNDEDRIARAQMECGHAIASSTMFYYVKQSFANNYTASDIACPVPNCGKKWDWGLVSLVADMDQDELTYYNKLRAKRICSDLTECRSCGKMVNRPKTHKEMRVRCVCSSREFCFQCGETWRKADSKLVCGNKSCRIVQDLNATLRKEYAKEECVDQLGNVLPKVRACPRCLTIFIRKKASCKATRCKGCDKTFCFRCLTPANDSHSLQCSTGSDHFKECTIVGLQQF